MKIYLPLFLLFSQLAYSYSTVQYFEKAGQRPGTCSGNFGQSGLITGAGFKDSDLRNGIPCGLADFDSNGSSDYLFTKCDKSDVCQSVLVLMNKNEVLKAVTLESKIPLKVYPRVEGIAPNIPAVSRTECKLPSTDLLVKIGPPHIFYALNKDLSGVEKITECPGRK